MLKVLLLFLATILQCHCQKDEPAFCSSFSSFTELTKETKQVETVVTILDDISPELSEALRNLTFSNTTEMLLRDSYNALAAQFGQRPSVTSYNNFVEAVNAISFAKAEACSDPSFKPNVKLVSELAEKFVNATFGTDKDIDEARSLFGKLLCLNTREESEDARRKRQTDCDNKKKDDTMCVCSDDVAREGLLKVQCICEFFACLRQDFSITEAVFGFESATDIIDECLAFVLDTTGSMSGEIEVAKQIVQTFLASEDNLNELQCYLLIPFNDHGHTSNTRLNVGAVSVVYTDREVGSLVSFTNDINALTADGGGDYAEYALDGMIVGLQATYDKGDGEKIQLMNKGSQMVVITDAPTKNEELEQLVIQEAIQRGVCLHFLLFRYGNDSIYRRIAQATSGTILEYIDTSAFAKFVTTYRQNPCVHLTTTTPSQKKRSTAEAKIQSKRQAADDRCDEFYVSSFAYLLRLTLQAPFSRNISIFHPNGSILYPQAPRGLALYSEPMPASGKWKVCASVGSLETSVNQQIIFDSSVAFINEGSEMPSTTPPPLCTSSRIALLSSQAGNISYLSLHLIQSDGRLRRRINMKKCQTSGFFASDIVTFPQGTFTAELDGFDVQGVRFKQDTTHTLAFNYPNNIDYQLVTVGEQTVDIDHNTSVSFNFQLTNPSVYSTSFRFASSYVKGFDKMIDPLVVIVPPNGSAEVVLTLSISDQRFIKIGSTYKFILFASNGCKTLRATIRVRMK